MQAANSGNSFALFILVAHAWLIALAISSPAVSHCKQTHADVPTRPDMIPGYMTSLDSVHPVIRPVRKVGRISSVAETNCCLCGM